MKDVHHLLQLEVGLCGQRYDVIFQLVLRAGALEVEAVGNLTVSLVDGIGGFVSIEFTHDIERRHWILLLFFGLFVRSVFFGQGLYQVRRLVEQFID